MLKANYTIRCSMKSSTSYIKNFILYMHSLFSKWSKFGATNFRLCEQNHFLVHYNLLFLISSFYHLICFIKRKQNIPQDAAWRALQFTKNSLYYIGTFCFKNMRNSVRPKMVLFAESKTGCTEFWPFWKQR